ncbi:V-type proton ATPase subunit S1 [Nematostella vectensis]|uniref:V-type proton ATPase subunit S1 n=1 Tax=Nematostella vectensis TaxID=45351 RepID=UPI00207723DC|nr:V-type proton ATPase subunit S1 [Nematostella vectensis]
MADRRLFLLCSAFVVICHFTVEAVFPVPVFIWSKESSLTQDSSPLAGHTLSTEDFQNKYLQKVLHKPQTVALFVQDRLSVDDFTRYGDAFTSGSHGAFNNLKITMDKANSSIVLPSVDSTFEGLTSGLTDYIKSQIDGKLFVVNEEDVDSFSIDKYTMNQQRTNVFIINLRPVELSSPSNAGLVFSQNDQLMASITKQIAASNSPSYTCILTGDAPSKIVLDQQIAEVRASLPHDRLRRDADPLDADNSRVNTITFGNGTLFVNGDCVFMNMAGLVVRSDNKTFNILNTTSLTGTVQSKCSNVSDSSVDLNLKTTELSTFKLRVTFNLTQGAWYCKEMKLTATGGDWNLEKTYPCQQQVQIPMQMSYHCYNATFKGNGSAIRFLDFQVQAYGIENGRFSYAYDCVGFFSIPILMGLLTVGVLLMILFFGVMAVFSITTMDRFDDPRGPGINIGSTVQG